MSAPRLSIAALVAVLLLVVSTAVLGGFARAHYVAERELRVAQLRAEHVLAADQMAISLALPAWNFDRPQIDRIVESALRNQNVVAVAVRLADVNHTLHARVRDEAGVIRPVSREPDAAGLPVESRSIVAEMDPLGTVRVWVTPRFMAAALAGTRDRLIRDIVVFDLLLVLFLYLLLWRLVLRPVQALQRHAAAVSAGGEGILPPGRPRFYGELESLRVSLNEMLGLLQSRFAALQASEERFELAVRGSTDGLWDWNVQTDEVFYAGRFRALLGYTEAEFPGSFLSFESCLHPEDTEPVLAALSAHLERQVPYDVQYRLRTKAGEYRWFRARGQAVWDASGRPARMAGSITDVTERRLAEAALRESEEKFSRAFRSSPDAITVTDFETGRHIEVNDGYQRVFGFAREEVIGRTSVELGVWRDLEDRGRLAEAVLANGFVHDFEARGWNRRREPIIVLLNAELAELQGRRCLVTSAHDITAQRRAEAALRHSEQRLREIFAHTTDAIFLLQVTPAGEFIYEAFNPASERASGLSDEQVRHQSPADVMPPDVAAKLAANYRRCLAAGQPIRYEEEVRFAAGARIFDTLLVPIRNEEGRIYRLAGFARDVTEHRCAERALQESEARLQAVLNNFPYDFWSMDAGGWYQFQNTTSIRLWGSLLGKRFEDIDFSPETREHFVTNNRRALGGEVVRGELRVRADGEERVFSEIIAPVVVDGQVRGILGTNIDITEQVGIALALRESEEKFAKAFRASPDGISITELATGRYIEVNEGYSRLLGHTRAELLGRSSLDVAIWEDPDDRDRFVARLLAHRSVCDFELRGRTRDGRCVVVLVSAELVELGGRECIVSVLHDITDRKRAEEALRESEQRFRSYFQLATVGFAITSVTKQLLEVNDQYCETLGYSRAELEAKTWAELTHPEDLPGDVALFESALAGQIDGYTLDKRFLRREGRVIYATISVRCVRRPDNTPDYFVSLLQDITEKREAALREQQARQEYTRQLIASQEAERRRIAGELHDSLGQNLLLIKNRAQLALAIGPPHPRAREQLDGIGHLAALAIAEVRQISRDLRPYQVDQLGLTRALEAMLETAATASGLVIERKLETVDEVFPLEAAINLYRVVQESLNNVLKHSGAGLARVELERDLRLVRLLIQDDGRGFDARTGSEPGNNRGFGLRNIVERVSILGGTVTWDSRPGQGTRMEVRIPCAE